MLDAVFSQQSDMLFPKGTPLLLRAAATAILAVGMLLVLVPCWALFVAVSPESVSQHFRLVQLPATCWAVWALVSLWAALNSSRLWRVFGKARGSSGQAGPVGHVAGGPEYRGGTSGGGVAHIALKAVRLIPVTASSWFARKNPS
jgi:hypothetical protein